MGMTSLIQLHPAGGRRRPLSGVAGFGVGTTAGTYFLALLYATDLGNHDCFEGREGSGSTMVTVPKSSHRNRNSDSPSQATGTYLNSNHSQICHPVAEMSAS